MSGGCPPSYSIASRPRPAIRWRVILDPKGLLSGVGDDVQPFRPDEAAVRVGIEITQRNGVAGRLEGVHDTGDRPGGGQHAGDLPVLVARLLVDEDVLERDLVALDPRYLRDVGDLARAVPQAALL